MLLLLATLLLQRVLVAVCSTDKGDLKSLLFTKSGLVSFGEYEYFNVSMRHSHSVLIRLTSSVGDSDLFISHATSPTYSQYDYKADTCGIDEVVVPFTYPRSFLVGVYGAQIYANSTFQLTVYMLPQWRDDYARIAAAVEKETRERRLLLNSATSGDHSNWDSTYEDMVEEDVYSSTQRKAKKIPSQSPSSSKKDSLKMVESNQGDGESWIVVILCKIVEILLEVLL